MSEMNKDYCIGIDYGTSNSCVGIFMNGTIQIAPNRIGERTTPSIVCFTEENKNKALVGEETLSQKIENYKNTIYEVKRFIGLSYEEFKDSDYDKDLNYDIINDNGIPKIKVSINGKENLFSAEDISSIIIKKMVQCAEDFIAQSGEGVSITKAIITVPAHFSDEQKDAVKNAAKLAGITVPRIINEPTAAALAYGVGQKLVSESQDSNMKKENHLYTSVCKYGGDSGEAPLAIERFKSKSSENAIVFDLGGGTLDVTLLNITKNNEGIINFEVEGTDGDIHLGGSDFDSVLINYCIKDFCKQTGNKEEDVRQDKKSCKRLKIKCENAKKLLSLSKETIINIGNFFKNEDLYIRITRDFFEDLCKDLYDRIKKLLLEVLEEQNKQITDIDEIILVGGATRMIGVKNLLRRMFGDEKVKDNLNPDEAVAFGATMEAAKMVEKNKVNFNLQDIIAYNVGIECVNEDKEENGTILFPIIKKNSKIPSSAENSFSTHLSKEYPEIKIKIYEGNKKRKNEPIYIKNCNYLGEMSYNVLNHIGLIDYKVKLSVDVNGQLTASIIIDSLGINKEEIIKKVTRGFVDKVKKKIKICKSIDLKPLSVIIESIKISKEKLSESYNPKNKLKNLNDLLQCYEDLVNKYMLFIKDNELVYEKVYLNTKELFSYYIERIKLLGIREPEIIKKIKEYMKNLISAVGYVEDLLDMFVEIKQIDELKNIFYEIFVNFMELMNNEGLEKKKAQKFSRYYSKLYFEREFYIDKKYIKENDKENMSKEIRNRYNKQKTIDEEELNKVNSFANFIEKRVKEGRFIYGNSGYTMIGKKIDKYERDMNNLTVEESGELLDLFQTMVDSFDKKDNSLGEAYCLSHIIFINYKIFKRSYDNLYIYINRLKTILFSQEDSIDWIKDIKELLEQIESKNKDE